MIYLDRGARMVAERDYRWICDCQIMVDVWNIYLSPVFRF